MLVVGVGSMSTNPISKHRDLPNNTQINSCDDFHSCYSSIDKVSAAIAMRTLSGDSTMATHSATPPSWQDIPQSMRLDYIDYSMDTSHVTTIGGATLAILSPGASSSSPCRTSWRRVNSDDSRDESNRDAQCSKWQNYWNKLSKDTDAIRLQWWDERCRHAWLVAKILLIPPVVKKQEVVMGNACAGMGRIDCECARCVCCC